MKLDTLLHNRHHAQPGGRWQRLGAENHIQGLSHAPWNLSVGCCTGQVLLQRPKTRLGEDLSAGSCSGVTAGGAGGVWGTAAAVKRGTWL